MERARDIRARLWTGNRLVAFMGLCEPTVTWSAVQEFAASAQLDGMPVSTKRAGKGAKR